MLSMRFRISKLHSALYVALRSLKPFFAFLITSTKEDSIKPASPENLLLWRPLSMKSLPSELDQTGWRLREWRDISEDYEIWYSELENRFAARRQGLRERFVSELVAYTEDYYCSLLEAIRAGALGGAIVYAHTNSRGA